ncbi:MAG: NUDIX hydrolase [bacterium]
MSKPENWYYQSGIIPYRKTADSVQIMLVTSRKASRWVIPKGIIEKDLSPYLSAAKEAFEEAGILGLTDNNELGEYQYSKWEGTCKVKVYSMEVTEELERWPEDFRSREWFDIDEAIAKVEEEGLKEIIKLFKKNLPGKSTG